MITALLLRWRQPLFFLSFLLGFEDLEGVFQPKRFHDSVVLLGIAADERISRFLSPLEHHHQQTACTGLCLAISKPQVDCLTLRHLQKQIQTPAIFITEEGSPSVASSEAPQEFSQFSRSSV